MTMTDIDEHHITIAGSRFHRAPTSLAVMLYGSHARKTNVAGSDIDIVELVPFDPQVYEVGPVSVTQYTPGHLSAMARSGSLFVRHLSMEGILLHDPDEVLGLILEEYVEPVQTEPIKMSLRLAGRAIDLKPGDPDNRVPLTFKLGFHVLMTWLYLEAQSRQLQTFDARSIVDYLSLSQLQPALTLKRKKGPNRGDVRIIAAAIEEISGDSCHHTELSMEAYLSTIADDTYAASLVSAALSGARVFPYSTVALPPVNL